MRILANTDVFESWDDPAELESMMFQAFNGKTFDMSSSFSGIMAFEVAARTAAQAINRRNQKYAADHGYTYHPFTVSSVFSAEWDKQCVEEMFALPPADRPGCCFGDQCDFLSDAVTSRLDAFHGSDVDSIRATIMTSPLRNHSYCYIHARQCSPARASWHCAGSPCTDHSGLNKSRQKMAGRNNRCYFTWCKQRLTLKEPEWVHENAPAFGMTETERNLGKLYKISIKVLSPHLFGWPARRWRQFLTGRLRSLNAEVDYPIRFRDETSFMHVGFYRKPGITQMEFCVATEDETSTELEWAKNRPLVPQHDSARSNWY